MALDARSYGALVYNGETWERLREADIYKPLSAVTITTIATVWTPATGKRLRFLGMSISVSVAMNVLFEDNEAGAGNFLFRTPALVAGTPYTIMLPGNGKLLGAINNVLKATGSATGTITGTLFGCEE